MPEMSLFDYCEAIDYSSLQKVIYFFNMDIFSPTDKIIKNY